MKSITKKFKKIVIFILAISFIFFTPNVHAEDSVVPGQYEPGEIVNGGEIARIGNIIIGAIQLFGSMASVIILIIIGIKFLVGSVEEKAEYKEMMMPYIIGAVMLFSISNLLGIISDVFS